MNGMSLLESILETVFGKVHFMVLVGNKPAIEVSLHDRDITVDIKNPVLAIELGLEEFFGGAMGGGQGKKVPSESPESMLERIKSMGYRIRIKYKMLELDL